jgi:methionyl-tRNA formyltransferase
MKKIVFLGAKEIGYECLNSIIKFSETLDFEVVGVLTNKRGAKIKDLCNKNGIKLLESLEDYLDLEQIDITISIQYHEILKKIHIDKAEEIIVNLHMAPLPEYRGCNQFSFAIIDKIDFFGTTIHRLEEGIDSGGIISEKRFKIDDDIWINELYNKTFIKSIELFNETFPLLISGNYSVIPQYKYFGKRTTSLHLRKEIFDIKKIDLSWSKEKIERHIRASYMPGFEPPFFLLNDKKVHFKLENL